MAKKRLAPDAGKRVAKYIRAHLGEVLEYTTLDGLCGTSSSNQQYNYIVGPLVKDGVLIPKGKQVIRGNEQAPIYRTYRICTALPRRLSHSKAFMEGTANMGVLETALADLDPRLTENGFLAKNLPAAKAWHDELVQLGAWLSTHEGPQEPAIMEERSFEIFHNEKLLGDKPDKRGDRSLMELINNMGLAPRLYLRTEGERELVYFVPRTMRRVLTILIVENHAPFVHVQKALARGVRTFFGRHVDGVVYGSGFAVLGEDTLSNTEQLFSGGGPVRYLYWGDIDRPGIAAYERLAEKHDVKPLLGAYKAMIAHAGESLPASNDQSVPPHGGIDIAKELDARELEVYLCVIAGCLRIPQEAVPPATYDGSDGTHRLTLTLRTRAR